MNNSFSIVVTGANGQLGKELSELAPLYPQFNFVFLTKEDLPIHESEAVINFLKTMMKLMSEKDEVNVVNDQLGSPTYAHDLAGCILQIMTSNLKPQTSNPGGIYHFSNNGIITWYDFAIAIKELSGSSCKINPITTEHFPTPAKRPAYSVLDKTKIQQTFGIKLKDWKESLDVCLQKIKNAKRRS